MAILRNLTKRLFGLIDPKADAPTIVDGEIIQTPKNINVQTHICENTHIHKHTNTQNPIGNGKHPENTEQIDTCKKFVRRKNPRQLCSSVPEQYFIFLGSAGRAARTIQEYTWDLGWWEQRCKPVDDIALETIEGAINTLQPANARRKIAALFAPMQNGNSATVMIDCLSLFQRSCHPASPYGFQRTRARPHSRISRGGRSR